MQTEWSLGSWHNAYPRRPYNPRTCCIHGPRDLFNENLIIEILKAMLNT